MNRFIAQNIRRIAPAASLGAFLALWGLASLNVNPDFLPSPRDVWEEGLRLFNHPVGGTSLLGHLASASGAC